MVTNQPATSEIGYRTGRREHPTHSRSKRPTSPDENRVLLLRRDIKRKYRIQENVTVRPNTLSFISPRSSRSSKRGEKRQGKAKTHTATPTPTNPFDS
jgi:hypothetical protein